MSNLVLYSIPAFIVLMVLEILWARRRAAEDIRGYEFRDARTSLSMGDRKSVV